MFTKMNWRWIFFAILCCFTLVTGTAGDTCPEGYCSLDGGAVTNCNIKADTLCSPEKHCNGDGQCYRDMGISEVYCNCSADLFGDACEATLNHALDLHCIHDFDCFGDKSSCKSAGGEGQKYCFCEPGRRGNRCQLSTRTLVPYGTSCYNGGTLYEQKGAHGCLCTCGFGGKYCTDVGEEVLEHVNCDNIICLGRGSCVRDRINRDRIVCDCEDGYFGHFCERDGNSTTSALKEITSRPCTKDCRNGGTCRISPSGSMECICAQGYTGVECNVKRTTISTSKPTRRSTRPTTVQVIVSECSDPFQDFICENDGTCVISYTRPRCECQCGFFGQHCQYSTDASRPDYKNWCDATDYGWNCDDDETCYVDGCQLGCMYKSDTLSTSSAMSIALMTSVPLAVLIILAALVAVVCSYLRKRRQSSQRSSPHQMSVWSAGTLPTYTDAMETGFTEPKDPPTYEEACEQPPTYSET